MNLPLWVEKHKRSILFLLLLMALGGVVTGFKLPVTLFPAIDFPRIVVMIESGDMPSDQMEIQVTRIAEEALRRIPDVQTVRSKTSRGSAEISITFKWGDNMKLALVQVGQTMGQIVSKLPPTTTIQTRRMDPTVFPVMAYSLTSNLISQSDLYDFAQYTLRPYLSRVEGVAYVGIAGGTIREYQVICDPVKLEALGLTLADVHQVLASSNVIRAVGRADEEYKLNLVVSDTRFKNNSDIQNTVIKSSVNGVIRLEDIATVVEGVVPRWTKATADGKDAVLVSIYQQPNANSVQLAHAMDEALHEYSKQIPSGITLAKWYDQSILVMDSAVSVRDAMILGVILATLILFLFLRNLKITLIALFVVPTTLAITVLLLYLLGLSFNIMTLGGMAAAVGLIIDDATVMIEYLTRRIAEEKGKAEGLVLKATAEITRAFFGSTAPVVVVFLPLIFLVGVSGEFLKALSLTMASGLIISLMVAYLAIPVLADKLLASDDIPPHTESGFLGMMKSHYEQILTRFLSRRIWPSILVLCLIVAGYVGYQNVGSGFFPSMDEGGFVLDYRTPPGTSLEETDRVLRQVEALIRATPEVDTYSRRTGSQLADGLTEANEGDFFIRLKGGNRRSVDAVINDLRSHILLNVPGIEVEFAQLMEDLIGDLTAVPQPIEIKIFSDDIDVLSKSAIQIAALISKIDGVVDIKNGINPAGDALQIHIDPVKAAFEGMDTQSVTDQISIMMQGSVASKIIRQSAVIGIRVWSPATMRSDYHAIEEIRIKAPDGHLFPLKRIAMFEKITGEPQITRDNLKRIVAVTARISGRDMGSVVKQIKHTIDTSNILTSGVYYEIGGLYHEQQSAFMNLAAVLIAAIALVFAILLYLFEDFKIAMTIIIMPLLSIASAFIALYLSKVELNISAMMGLTMVVGMVTETGVYYFYEFVKLNETISCQQALILAGKNRLRPIMMTSSIAILTLLPLAFAMGQGSAMQQPLAIVIIAGLIVQMPLVLLIAPVVYNTLMSKK